MPVPAVGCDVQEVAGVAASLRRFGERYLDRVLHPAERGRAVGPGAAAYVAGRFAAKEAVFKTLRGGPDDAMPWPDIEIAAGAYGPVVHLHGRAAQLAERARIAGLSVSISHTDGFAFAVAVASTADLVAPPSKGSNS